MLPLFTNYDDIGMYQFAHLPVESLTLPVILLMQIDLLFFEPTYFLCQFQDPRFNQDVDTRTGYKTHSILCGPIHDMNGKVVGVAQAINRATSTNGPPAGPFDSHDEKVKIVLFIIVI